MISTSCYLIRFFGINILPVCRWRGRNGITFAPVKTCVLNGWFLWKGNGMIASNLAVLFFYTVYGPKTYLDTNLIFFFSQLDVWIFPKFTQILILNTIGFIDFDPRQCLFLWNVLCKTCGLNVQILTGATGIK